ncbi:hypothetical protein [Derxia gummosa]|uniref:Uncharacterized protein n=1 Tax=Derxia gummosa DSM 723 TaxID=1121388 RepID=A0A8B6X8F0_9BURK|nr:hypothetical protein [Derxia gummosa]
MSWAKRNLEREGAIIHVNAYGLEKLDFKRGPLRKAIRREARAVAKAARQLVARTAVSRPGEYPGKDTGALQKSITAKPSKSGMSAAIFPDRNLLGISPSDDGYYPAILYYGVRVGAHRRRDHQKQHDNGADWRIAPRSNYVLDAAIAREMQIRDAITEAMAEGLKHIE